jgi:redox-sensitive bicupin YhaK (pirin superfamily)
VLETVQDANLFVYVLEGAGRFAATEHPVITPHRAVLFQKGDELVARAEDEGLRFLVFSAKSLREPVAWHETIVMNADEELSDAMRELRQGRFIR